MAEIYGSFGRVISGNSLSQGVGNIARQILYDKIRRIFSAYRDEVTYDGAILDAATAIAKLNEILAMVDPSSEAASDIKSYIDSIRQTDRTRRAESAINALTMQDASTKDYLKLIRSLQQIASDPTITQSEKDALKASIANQVRYMIDNALKQYYEGGSITLDGKKIDLSLSGGADQLLSMIQDQIKAFPDMANEIGKSYDIARATVVQKEADILYTSKVYKTDSEKKAAYEERKKSYEKALEILKTSSYDLAQSTEALNLMESIQQLGDGIRDLGDRIAQTYANDMLNKYSAKLTDPFDAVDGYGKNILGAQRDEFVTAGTSLWDWVNTGVGSIDRVYDYFDRIVAQNGGKTTIEWDGKTYDISHNGIKNLILTAARTAAAASEFASKNNKVGQSDKTAFARIADGLGGFIKASEVFTIEDKYDAAYGQMQREVSGAEGDIFAIRNAYERFAKELHSLGNIYKDSQFADDLHAEADFYLGKGGDPSLWYRVTSGNADINDSNAAGQLTAQLIFQTISTPSSNLEVYIGLNGRETYGVRNVDSVATEFDPKGVARPEWVTPADDITIVSAIRIKDPLGGPTLVYQVAQVIDSKGLLSGYIGNINGQYFGLMKKSGGKYSFIKAADLRAAADANGLSVQSFMNLLETNNGKSRILLDWFKGFNTTGEDMTLSEVKTQVFDEPVGSETGIGGLTDVEKQQKVDEKLDALNLTLDDFSYIGSAGRSEGMEMFSLNNLFVTIDGKTTLAEVVLGKAAAQYVLAQWEARAAGGAYDNLKGMPGESGSGTGPLGRGVGGGRGTFGTGFMPRGGLYAGANDSNAGIGDMSTLEAQYLSGRGKAPTTRTSPLVNPAQQQQALIDFRAGERAAISPIAPVAPGIKPIAPGVKPIAPPVISPIKPISPISVAGDSLAERLAQARRLQSQSSTNSALAGFFRNSPFKIGL
jgi:hypothetical protein